MKALTLTVSTPPPMSSILTDLGILTITVGFVIAALGLVFLTELKIRVGPFAKEMIPAVVVVLWTFVLFPMVCAVPIVTLIDVEYYDEAYACVFLWAIISLLIAVTILFGFLNKLRHFANEFRCHGAPTTRIDVNTCDEIVLKLIVLPPPSLNVDIYSTKLTAYMSKKH